MDKNNQEKQYMPYSGEDEYKEFSKTEFIKKHNFTLTFEDSKGNIILPPYAFSALNRNNPNKEIGVVLRTIFNEKYNSVEIVNGLLENYQKFNVRFRVVKPDLHPLFDEFYENCTLECIWPDEMDYSNEEIHTNYLRINYECKKTEYFR